MIARSFHQQNRQFLTHVTDSQVIVAALERAGAQGVGWERIWGRTHDSRQARAHLLLRCDGPPTQFISVEIGGPTGVDDSTLGKVDMTHFPYDARLPGLRPVIAANQGAEVVRYRPGKRCTLRLRTDPATYLKVFVGTDVARLHSEATALWGARSEGRLAVAVARPMGFDDALGTQAQEEVPGLPVIDELFGPNGSALAHRMGAACASIPDAPIHPGTRLDRTAELARTRRRAAQVIEYVPRLRDRIEVFLDGLHELSSTCPAAPARPVHGSPHPNQWLDADGVLGLVDFDRLSVGEPELDVATFTAEVDFEATYRSDEISRAFVAGYEQHHGHLHPGRLALYSAHKRFAKVHRTVRALRVDGDERAAAHLAVAHQALLRPRGVGEVVAS